MNNNKRNVWLYFILTYTFSWVLWLPFVLSWFNIINLSEGIASLAIPAVALGAFGPIFGAVTVIVKDNGWKGVKEYFRRMFNFRVKWVYILIALLIPLITALSGHYITTLSGLDNLPKTLIPEDFPIAPIVVFVPYFIVMMLFGGGQEEFGWRGYAQEPLQENFGVIKASLIIGLLWGIWHLPLWYIPGDGHTYYSFFAFMIYILSVSVMFGIFYNLSGKKLIIPWIFHTMGNALSPMIPVLHMKDVPQPGYWIWAISNAILAIGIGVWFYKRQSNITKE